MALVVADRVKETTTTTGTGTYTLAGAVDGFQTFGAIGNGNTTYYACSDGTDYEVGIGTYTASGTTLARTTIIESSNSDAAVDWGSGSKQIFCTLPADKAVVKDSSGHATFDDSKKFYFGTDQDLQLFYDGSNAHIYSASRPTYVTGGGNLYLRPKNGENGIVLTTDGSAAIYHNNVKKAETTSTGFSVTGNITVSGNVDGVDVGAFKSAYDSHNHDGRYYTETEADNRFVNVSGDTMTGSIRLDQETLSGAGGTLTINLSNANNFKINMTANTTFAFSNKDAGRGGNLIIVQDATGGRTFTLPSECKTPVGGAAIVQSTGASEVAIVSYYVLDSSNILVNYIGDFA